MANPIDRIGQGFEEVCNGGFLLGPKGMTKRLPVQSKLALANELLDSLLTVSTDISKLGS